MSSPLRSVIGVTLLLWTSLARAERVVMKNGAVYEVQSLTISATAVRMVTLEGKSWSVLRAAVDVPATLRANARAESARQPAAASTTPAPTPRPAEPSPAPPPPAPRPPPEVKPRFEAAERRRPAPHANRWRLLLNGAYNGSPLSFSATRRSILYLEEATLASDYAGETGPALELGGIYGLGRGLGVGASVELFQEENRVRYNDTLPHPFFFERPRRLTGDLSGLSYRELALHLDLVYTLAFESVTLDAYGGPTFFRTYSDLLSDVEFIETFPYNSVGFASAEIEELKGDTLGYNVGAGVSYWVSRRFGLGFNVRFHRGRVKLAPTDAGAIEFNAGGLRAGGGLRFLF